MAHRPHTPFLLMALSWILLLPPALSGQEKVSNQSSIAEVFRATRFERLAAAGPKQEIRWKVKAFSHGLSAHQRMVAHIEVEIPGAELVKRASHERLISLVQVDDQLGNHYRDYGFIDLTEVTEAQHKQSLFSTWESFALPGLYTVNLALYDPVTGEHSFTQTGLHVVGLKNDSFAEIWRGVPAWEFWAPLKELRDNIFRPDIESRLHLALKTKNPLQVEVLADLTPSDLFHGSSRFYSRFLSVALPLFKDLSQIEVGNGSLDVATLDLRENRVTFQQDDVKSLDWSRLKGAVAPENGPSMINVTSLQQKHESPDFLRDEVLRRLDSPAADSLPENQSSHAGAKPFKVFIVVGSPMDFYAFHHFPAIDATLAENCVVYYLQYETYGPFATGAVGSVRKMLKPLQIRAMKVRTPESVRHALERIVREVNEMQIISNGGM